MATNPNPTRVNIACAQWAKSLIAAGRRVIIPEIADYEVRRELIRAKKTIGTQMLDSFCNAAEFLAIDTPAMRQAALLWAEARNQGKQAADNKRLDADMILIAQVTGLQTKNVVIATTNLKHLAPFFPAEQWSNIT